jgi:hypothetical protein
VKVGDLPIIETNAPSEPCLEASFDENKHKQCAAEQPSIEYFKAPHSFKYNIKNARTPPGYLQLLHEPLHRCASQSLPPTPQQATHYKLDLYVCGNTTIRYRT